MSDRLPASLRDTAVNASHRSCTTAVHHTAQKPSNNEQSASLAEAETLRKTGLVGADTPRRGPNRRRRPLGQHGLVPGTAERNDGHSRSIAEACFDHSLGSQRFHVERATQGDTHARAYEAATPAGQLEAELQAVADYVTRLTNRTRATTYDDADTPSTWWVTVRGCGHGCRPGRKPLGGMPDVMRGRGTEVTARRTGQE